MVRDDFQDFNGLTQRTVRNKGHKQKQGKLAKNKTLSLLKGKVKQNILKV